MRFLGRRRGRELEGDEVLVGPPSTGSGWWRDVAEEEGDSERLLKGTKRGRGIYQCRSRMSEKTYGRTVEEVKVAS